MPSGVALVRALYDSLLADVAWLREASPADPALSNEIAAALNHEARLLDARAFERWLELWDEDAIYWVPLSPDDDPGADQALFLDDHRRLTERVWRMRDTSAWGLQPPGYAVRLIGSVEAWPESGGGDVVVTSTIQIQYTRMQSRFSTSGRQIHHVRRGPAGWRIKRKIMLLPAQATGTPHLGWLL